MGSLTRKLRAATGPSFASAWPAHPNARDVARRARNQERARAAELPRPILKGRSVGKTESLLAELRGRAAGAVGTIPFGSRVELEPRSAQEPIVVDERNEPAERLEELRERSGLSVGQMSIGAGAVPWVFDLVQAAIDRDVEIIKARRAAKLGAVVLADGGVVPRDEAELVDGVWVRASEPAWPPPPLSPQDQAAEDAAVERFATLSKQAPESVRRDLDELKERLAPERPPARGSRLLSLLMCAGLAVGSDLPPRGSR